MAGVSNVKLMLTNVTRNGVRISSSLLTYPLEEGKQKLEQVLPSTIPQVILLRIKHAIENISFSN